MRRREFITLVGGTALAWPFVARAQQPDRVRRIGMLVLYSQTDREGQARIAAFLDTLLVSGWTALAELHRLTSTIPVVFTQVSDPVDSGFVASLARPGGNISGFQNFEPTIGGKWLGVLKEAAPNMRRAAMLFGTDSVATVAMLRAAEAVAPSLGVQMTAVDIHGGVEIERAIATFASEPDHYATSPPHPAPWVGYPIGGPRTPSR